MKRNNAHHEHNHHSLEHRIPDYKQYGITRRVLLRTMALLGLGELAGQILGTGSPTVHLVSRLAGESGHQQRSEEADRHEAEGLADDVEQRAQDLARDFEQAHPESEGLSEREKTLLFVDYAGVALFANGVYNLIEGKHITAKHYAALGILTKLKHDLSDEEGRHHLMDETNASIKALGIIAGTIVAAEGMNADLAKAYEIVKGESPEKKDQIALMTMLSSFLSPTTTTVGSATIIKNMSQDLAKIEGEFDEEGRQKYDPEIMAICVSHMSNLSGYLFFGDPPFIAMVEKYGFKEAVTWQAEATFPLLLYSTLSATYKLNRKMAEREGKTGIDTKKQAFRDAKDGIKRNFPFLMTFLTRSVMNAGRYFAMQREQDPRGIEIWVGEKLQDTLTNLIKLPFSEEFERLEDPEAGLVRGPGAQRIIGAEDAMSTLLAKVAEDGKTPLKIAEAAELPEEHKPDSLHVHQMRTGFETEDYDQVREAAKQLKIAPEVVEYAIQTVQDVRDNTRIDESILRPKKKEGLLWVLDKLNPLSIYRRTFSVDRMQAAMGHNLTDVVNVFPFQAGCVPFLVTAFDHARIGIQKGIEALGLDVESGVGQAMMEVAMFFLIEHFSNVADNYVGCKVGLELFPDKPQIALIAAIQGGSETSIGNMANVAQFDLQKFSLAESYGQWRKHLDNRAVALAHTLAIGQVQKIGILRAPAVKNRGSHGHEHHAATTRNQEGQRAAQATPRDHQQTTRRGFLNLLFGRAEV